MSQASLINTQIMQPITQPRPIVPQPAPLVTPLLPQDLSFTKGITGALNFPAARGSRVTIFDEDEDVFYIKSVDVYGNTNPIRVFDYKERVPESAQNSSNQESQTQTNEEIDQLKTELSDLKGQLSELTKLLSNQHNNQPIDQGNPNSNNSNNSNPNRKNYRKENRNG